MYSKNLGFVLRPNIQATSLRPNFWSFVLLSKNWYFSRSNQSKGPNQKRRAESAEGVARKMKHWNRGTGAKAPRQKC